MPPAPRRARRYCGAAGRPRTGDTAGLRPGPVSPSSWRCQPSSGGTTGVIPPEPPGGDAWERIPDRIGADPADLAESREPAGVLRQAVSEVLSGRQRRVFAAVIVDGVPPDALAAELRSTRNALYKTMFDARRKIRAHLVANGYLDEEPRTT